MSRLGKLKRLKDEISCLFHEKFDEKAIFNQLRASQQFSDITRGQVQSFYRHLKEDSKVEPSIEQRIRVINDEIEYFEEFPEEEHRVVERRQIKLELQFMDKHCKYQQPLSKFLIYVDESSNSPDINVLWQRDIKVLWQKRFLMTVKKNDANEDCDVYKIKVQDCFQGATKLFTAQKIDYLKSIHVLKFPYVLLHEYNLLYYNSHIRLAKFDFENDSLQVIQSFEFNNCCRILVNASDFSKFLLRKENAIHECKLVHDQILVGEKLALKSDFNFKCSSYSDKQLCELRFVLEEDEEFDIGKLTQVKMHICNLERIETLTYDLDSTSEALACSSLDNQSNIAWMRDTVFLTVNLNYVFKDGVIFTNPQMRYWKLVEFGMIDFGIDHIQSFDNENLMVCVNGRGHAEKIYKLQMRKPDFLRNMAWIAIIKLFKEAEIENPYEEARQYLPLNSELQPFVFTED